MSLFETLPWYQTLALIVLLGWFFSRLIELLDAIVYRIRHGVKQCPPGKN